MKNFIKRIPVPICGLMLGIAALGNLLQSYSEGIRMICGMIACILLILTLCKLICFPKMIQEDLNSPIMASVSATFPMAVMLLSVYLKPFIGSVSMIIWGCAILLHLVLMIVFAKRFLVHLKFTNVFASYYIVYVGIAVAAVSAPAYGMTASVGTAAFWFGFLSLICLLVLVSYRYLKLRQVPDPAKPLICIYAAPASLCLAGYTQSISEKSYSFILFLFILATVLYVFALIRAIFYLKLPFYPSYASFTFPFVISAIASKQTMACLTAMGRPLSWLSWVVLLETIVAVCFVVYVLIRFVLFLLQTK